jgi:ribonuclease P protein component
MGVPVAKRLRKQRDFQLVRAEGKRSLCGPFIFQCREVPDAQLPRRFGVIASRRVGNAVKRNRGKRLMRELFRLHESKLPESVDLVVVLRSGFDHFDFAELELRFIKACSSITK